MAAKASEQTTQSPKMTRSWRHSFIGVAYPTFKFLASFWLVPLIQVCAYLFAARSAKSAGPKALIVSSRSDQISTSFVSLLPQLQMHSVDVITHSANHSKSGLFSKLSHIYNFFLACQTVDFVFLDDTFLPVSYALRSKRLFKPKVVQLWHSAGLFKQVGLDVQNGKWLRYLMKINFRNFDVVAVSSAACRDAIAGFMGLDREKVVALGTSYTDRYFLHHGNHQTKSKPTIVYAPTFRGDAFNVSPSPIPEVTAVFDDLGHEYDSFISPHPHESADLGKYQYPFKLADTLGEIDVLVTDYSSIAMDYILANPNGKLILFVPDLERYERTNGFYVALEEVTPLIAHSATELVAAIHSDAGHGFDDYRDKYLALCDGQATDRLLKHLNISSG